MLGGQCVCWCLRCGAVAMTMVVAMVMVLFGACWVRAALDSALTVNVVVNE